MLLTKNERGGGLGRRGVCGDLRAGDKAGAGVGGGWGYEGAAVDAYPGTLSMVTVSKVPDFVTVILTPSNVKVSPS